MIYCPNCQCHLKDAASTCGSCGADFGPGSAWRPTKIAKVQRTPEFRETLKHPTTANALFAGMAFPLFAPGIGALAFVFTNDTRTPMFLAVVFFTFLGAYAFAIVPAAVAGVAYTAMALIATNILRLTKLSYPLVAALGFVSGLVGMAVKHQIAAGTFMPQTAGFSHMFLLAAGTGAILAMLTSWLAPIGTRNSRSPTPDA